MRPFLLSIMLVVCMGASSQEIKKPVPPVSGEAKAANKTSNQTKAQDASVQKPSAVFNVNVSGSLKVDAEGQQKSANAELNKWTDPSTWSNLFLVAITLMLVWLSWSQNNANKIIERAYVQMSHQPPGLSISTSGECVVFVEVKNFGRTPAAITDVFVSGFVLKPGDTLPSTPEYRMSQERYAISAFLVTETEFSYRSIFDLEPEELAEVRTGQMVLYVIGYTDYADKFKKRHRNGYARVYAPDGDNRARYRSDEEFNTRNNLVFIRQAGYNYDRERKKGEGNDWNQPT